MEEPTLYKKDMLTYRRKRGSMPSLSRAGITVSASDAKGLRGTYPDQDIMLKEGEEGYTHDASVLHLDLPSFADVKVSPIPLERICDQSIPHDMQSDKQDNGFSVRGHGQLDVIPYQIPESEQPNFLEGVRSIFEHVFDHASPWMQLGEIKHFYMRRHKRLKLCSAPSDDGLQMDGEIPFVSSETPNDMLAREEVNDEMASTHNVSPGLEGRSLNLENENPTLPSLHLSESHLLQSEQDKKSLSRARQAARWAREVMRLVGNSNLFDEENTKMDDRDLSCTGRKRRRSRNTSNLTSMFSEKLGMNERFADQNATVLHREPHQKWRDVDLSSTDPAQLIGCKCKVYWPEDKVWYTGVISGYNKEASVHHVDYDDGDQEDLILAKELVKIYLSNDDVFSREILLKCGTDERKGLYFQELAALATLLEDFQEEFEHGELIWAKIKGHPMWPAFVIDERYADAWGLDAPVHENTLAVQFFGSYEYARINLKQAMRFSKGLLSKLYGKCKKDTFDQGLKEAERYLKEGKLPDVMSKLQDDAPDPDFYPSPIDMKEEDQDFMGDERTHKTKKSIKSLYTCPVNLGDLQVLSLGKIVRDSEFFHTENHIWTEGYTAVCKFPSLKDPERLVDYKMEILKDTRDRNKPLFCVSPADGEQVEGSSPSMCWKKIYQKLDKVKDKLGTLGLHEQHQTSPGDAMFGFTNRRILRLIQALPYARTCNKFTGWLDKKVTETSEELLQAGFMPVEIDLKHADRCSVCDLDEDYTNNLFLQCDRCRILVHMHCYGESEPPNGHLWLCQLCREGVSAQNAFCCLCPVQGGAMKRTTDGRWAHLTCAMWIPETCFLDVKTMGPIDGLKSINKERWKLTCSICKVPYGVCIQCSDPSCCVAYHVLCARSSGYALEVSEDSSHMSRDENEDLDSNLQFLSFCKRHIQKSEKGTLARQSASSKPDLGYYAPTSSSGCARTEPYNRARRRGRQEPEVRAAASAKRFYVEKLPYLVGGLSSQGLCASHFAHKFGLWSSQSRNVRCRKSSLTSEDMMTVTSTGFGKQVNGNVAELASSVWSVADRYKHMCISLKHRLTFGKSAIHGWGVFTKISHCAGDMVIEYAGEVVRPIVADLRERSIYNTLVGAGTYMFRIDDERVVDATREGSIAHLINHSCEPNCFSRVVTVGGGEHIIIFAKRDIDVGEELSYDYRFTSKGEQLECFCGFPSCRGFVNSNDDEDTSKLLVPRRDIMAWDPS